MTTELHTRRDYVSVGLSEDKTTVKLTLHLADRDGSIEFDQEAALSLAGQIQFHAMTIRKPTDTSNYHDNRTDQNE